MTASPPAPSISAALVARGDLSPADRRAMYALLDRHFIGVTRERFDTDLEEKNWVLLLHEASGALLGFSTMRVYETTFDGRPISIVRSGDTIVDPSAWGSTALPREWIKAVNQLRERYPNGPWYWLLLTSGFRTYRLLSTFWRTFWPCHALPTPTEAQRCLDAIAGEAFADQYEADRGIVRFASPQILRPPLAGIPAGRRVDPHVSFFVHRNPGHARGDELVCLCELTDSNLTRAGNRMIHGAAERRA